MPTDIKITTELLYRGALIFALIDAVSVPLLIWRVNTEAFRSLKLSLIISAALVWYLIWSWAIGNYWATVYAYVFPSWARPWIPWIAFVTAGLVARGMWSLALRLRWNAVASYCLIGGFLGSLTHIWAIQRGIVTNPPLLQEASPLAAVVIAFFEYMFYWCMILVAAKAMDWVSRKLNTTY